MTMPERSSRALPSSSSVRDHVRWAKEALDTARWERGEGILSGDQWITVYAALAEADKYALSMLEAAEKEPVS